VRGQGQTMNLREPPRPAAPQRPDSVVRWLLAVNLAAVLTILALWIFEPVTSSSRSSDENFEVAAKLLAAGVVDGAAAMYEKALSQGGESAQDRASIAYSLGAKYLERGSYEEALRWFYEAESESAVSLPQDLDSKVVHTLERLGRHHAAQAALDSRARLEPEGANRPPSDPVVARIGDREILRSEVLRALDDLPPQIAAGLASEQGRTQILQHFVADELLWRKASKLEYDKDPEVRRRHEVLLKQLVASRFIEQEIVSKIVVDESDLRNYFESNKDRYKVPLETGGDPVEAVFEQVRAAVERDYRGEKAEGAYRGWVESELETSKVEMYPERLTDES